ncbi:hypothetical protein PPERSA_05537 [Pseudocohnilembus persalinus]|uniref:ENTH domain-containing protein n=1 Tax=Pseudocohnilembus persalinus TaxID=266149 RepID=A0A0V0QT91_PSEPJ|nr:hypothetical protein PPERSA_05537 [Pseudocohnilembus persalinus]|eukprot:KRX05428.1 hypothetical protein PPERSA_05537 [Pseudocohnilembus persalinus]
MKSIQKNLKLLNKSPYQRSVIKIFYTENNEIPKQKHVKRVLQAIFGEDQTIMPIEAYSIFIDTINKVKQNQWSNALNMLLVFHKAIKENSEIVKKISKISDPLKPYQFQPGKKSEGKYVYIHKNFTQIYSHYLSNISQNYPLFQQLEQQYYKEKSQLKGNISQIQELKNQILVQKQEKINNYFRLLPGIEKLIQASSDIIQIENFIRLSLQNFDKLNNIKYISTLLYNEAAFYLEILNHFVYDKIDYLFQCENHQKIKILYRLYCEYTKILKSFKNLDRIKEYLQNQQINTKIPIIEINIEKNKQIEFFMLNLQPDNDSKSTSSLLNGNINKNDINSLNGQLKNQENQISIPSLNSFQKLEMEQSQQNKNIKLQIPSNLESRASNQLKNNDVHFVKINGKGLLQSSQQDLENSQNIKRNPQNTNKNLDSSNQNKQQNIKKQNFLQVNHLNLTQKKHHTFTYQAKENNNLDNLNDSKDDNNVNSDKDNKMCRIYDDDLNQFFQKSLSRNNSRNQNRNLVINRHLSPTISNLQLNIKEQNVQSQKNLNKVFVFSSSNLEQNQGIKSEIKKNNTENNAQYNQGNTINKSNLKISNQNFNSQIKNLESTQSSQRAGFFSKRTNPLGFIYHNQNHQRQNKNISLNNNNNYNSQSIQVNGHNPQKKFFQQSSQFSTRQSSISQFNYIHKQNNQKQQNNSNFDTLNNEHNNLDLSNQQNRQQNEDIFKFSNKDQNISQNISKDQKLNSIGILSPKMNHNSTFKITQSTEQPLSYYKASPKKVGVRLKNKKSGSINIRKFNLNTQNSIEMNNSQISKKRYQEQTPKSNGRKLQEIQNNQQKLLHSENYQNKQGNDTMSKKSFLIKQGSLKLFTDRNQIKQNSSNNYRNQQNEIKFKGSLQNLDNLSTQQQNSTNINKRNTYFQPSFDMINIKFASPKQNEFKMQKKYFFNNQNNGNIALTNNLQNKMIQSSGFPKFASQIQNTCISNTENSQYQNENSNLETSLQISQKNEDTHNKS